MGMMRSVSILIAMVAVAGLAAEPKATWVALDASGKLVYRTLPHGDRIVDFSYAGYGGGGVVLPRVPVARTVTPSDGDDSAAIQKAIDEVSVLPLVKDGLGSFRGAVLLAPGTFECSKTLYIAASGVVLRGSGATVTTLKLTGDPHTAVAISGKAHIQTVGSTLHITQPYVASGSQTIALEDASSIAPGDSIRITRYTTPEWLHLMGMDKMARDGKDEAWVGNSIATVRTVTARQGNVLTLDVPLTDSYDRAYLPPEGAEVVKITQSGGIDQDGVEALHLVAPSVQVGFHDALFQAIAMRDLRDGWVRGLVVDNLTEGVEAGDNTQRITIEDVAFHHDTTVTSPAKPADFILRGAQALVLRCSSTGNDEMYVITGARNQGPNVVLESTFIGDGHVQPHQRWSTGLLVDSVKVPKGGIDLMNRGEMGSGHGWTMGWAVVWNSSAATMLIQNPPGAANWAIGSSGDQQRAAMKIIGVHPRDAGPPLPQGFIESQGHAVTPASLYRAQLAERLGPSALKALEP
jgi:hypothetical protein